MDMVTSRSSQTMASSTEGLARVTSRASVVFHAASAVRSGIDNLYFDVLCGPPESCQRALQSNTMSMTELALGARGWQRLGLLYWVQIGNHQGGLLGLEVDLTVVDPHVVLPSQCYGCPS